MTSTKPPSTSILYARASSQLFPRPLAGRKWSNACRRANPELLVFTSDQVLQRVEKLGDLFEPVLKLKQKLPALEKLVVPAEKSAPVRPAKAKRVASGTPRRAANTRSRKDKTQNA